MYQQSAISNQQEAISKRQGKEAEPRVHANRIVDRHRHHRAAYWRRVGWSTSGQCEPDASYCE